MTTISAILHKENFSRKYKTENSPIEICWIPLHVDVGDTEKADALARNAAKDVDRIMLTLEILLTDIERLVLSSVEQNWLER